jgi:hypothetical protein
MEDTPSDVKARVREILLAKSPAERAEMASRMSVAARRAAEAGVRAKLGPLASHEEVQRAVFLRFYGRELGLAHANAIVDALEQRARRRSGGVPP